MALDSDDELAILALDPAPLGSGIDAAPRDLEKIPVRTIEPIGSGIGKVCEARSRLVRETRHTRLELRVRHDAHVEETSRSGLRNRGLDDALALGDILNAIPPAAPREDKPRLLQGKIPVTVRIAPERDLNVV